MGDFLMKENKNISFLNSISKTCEMGIVGINDVFDKANKSDLREILQNQKDEYNKILTKTSAILTSYGAQEPELNTMVKMSSKMMSDMKLMGKEDGRIAKMMIEGTNKGIIKMNKGLNENPDADNEIVELAQELITLMEHNIEELKIYL